MSHFGNIFLKNHYDISRWLLGLFYMNLFGNVILSHERIERISNVLFGFRYIDLISFQFSAEQVSSLSLLMGITGLVFSFLFSLGALKRLTAILIWIDLILLLKFAPLLIQIYTSYSVMLLAVFIFFSPGKFFDFRTKENDRKFSATWWSPIYIFIFLLSLMISGLAKLRYSSWIDGSVGKFYCSSNYISRIANHSFCDLPDLFFKISTYGTLFVEVFALAAFVFLPSFRKWIFLVLVLMFSAFTVSVQGGAHAGGFFIIFVVMVFPPFLYETNLEKIKIPFFQPGMVLKSKL